MTAYPLTPYYIKNAPKDLAELWKALERYLLTDICSRLSTSGELTSTAIEQIRTLKRRGYTLDAIKEFLKKTLRLSDKELDGILSKAIEDNKRYYSTVLDTDKLFEGTLTAEAFNKEVDAILAQTKGTMKNLTNSLGFSVNVNGKLTFLPIAKAYQKVLDNAEMKVWTGAQSYNEAMRDAVAQLANSGVKAVTYDKDGKQHVDQVDVAVRRAVMTGITQLGSKFSEETRKEVPTEYIEVSAHSGARDTDVKGRPWANHKSWQGKVYSTRDGDKYPNIYKVCGWQEVDGLEGANCRHMHFPFWDGISERTWTDEQLKNIDPPDITWNGKKYNAYAATQQMRSIERQLRRTKRQLLAFKASGDADAYKTAAIRYKRLNSDYDSFSKAAGLRKEERGNIAEFGPKDGREALKAAL